MTKAIENLLNAQKYAMSIRPQKNGFPILAEVLRLAGVRRNLWALPSCQSIYITELGSVVQPGTPLVTEPADVPAFDKSGFIQALRKDQAGEISFPEFLKLSWEAGVVAYNVNFEDRTCTYFGAQGETYVEEYPAVEVKS